MTKNDVLELLEIYKKACNCYMRDVLELIESKKNNEDVAEYVTEIESGLKRLDEMYFRLNLTVDLIDELQGSSYSQQLRDNRITHEIINAKLIFI